jgi:DNA-binding CsgD family transcriptional regulator
MYFRLLNEEDVVNAASLLNPALLLTPAVRSALPSIWRRLMTSGQLHVGGVVDDVSGSRAVLACGMTAFVDERFITHYLASPVPYLSGVIYEHVLDGRSPILSIKEVADANAAGRLNLVVLHFGTARPPVDDAGRAILTTAQAGFRQSHFGYRVRRVLAEAYGPELQFHEAGGFRVKSDYARFYDHHPEPPPPSRPFLMGLFAEDPESRITGTNVSYLFDRREPRLLFSAAEQRVLSRAMLDESDEEIAAALHLSREAIKKTWSRIHHRVAIVASELMREPPSEGARGRERRRRLLQYLRYHLEELRPFSR